jgi:type II secretory pathway pseudopilin PulG
MKYTLHRNTQRGMTLVEVVFATLILGAAFFTTMGVLSYSRLEQQKAMDRDIMLDFLHHYLEVARGGPYDNIVPGQPINALYDGTRDILLPAGGTTKISITFPPSDGNWISLNTTSFQVFHPDLVWLSSRDPQYRVTITTQQVGGYPRARTIRLELRWHPPLGGVNQWQTLNATTVVYPEFN